jgi:hypothetical protein
LDRPRLPSIPPNVRLMLPADVRFCLRSSISL